jgi:hypothetical protein
MKPIPSVYQRYKARHIKAGLCVECSRKPETGLLHCRVCLEKMRESRMARHPKFCPECGKLIKPEERQIGKRFHKLCIQKRRYPQQHRSAAVAYQERHRKLGLCYSCPRKAFKGGLCKKHYGMVLVRYYSGSVRGQQWEQ